MEYLRVKKWEEFQHYKDRSPPWIKLHRSVLDDYEFCRLRDASKAHLMLIWVLASQSEGRIPADPKFLQAKLGLDEQPDLKVLVDQGFLIPEHDASNTLQEPEQSASKTLVLARSREERREETEKNLGRFAEFWAAYPRKVAKQDALKAWTKLKLVNGDFERVMGALQAAKLTEQWSRDNGKFIPFPATWLNGRRFEDEGAATSDPFQGAL